MLSDGQQGHGRSNKIPATIIFMITHSVIDFSSKPCFEEKQSILCFYI